ncbi:MAG: TatD family hydrolase [Leptolinea sp.]
MIVDTHCHLNFNSFREDLPKVLQNARAAGISRMVVPAIDIETSREVVSLNKIFPEIFAAVGIHPNEAANFSSNDINILRVLAEEKMVVAIGEIGLDNHHKDVPIEQQIQVFKAQLQLASDSSLPVIIHNREADQEIIECLTDWIDELVKKKSRLVENPGILHAFSSNMDLAEKAISLGFLIGAAGPITFRNAAELQNVFRNLPPEKVVIETDAPFLTPHPFRGKRNEPFYCFHIAQKLAELWQISEEKVEEITTKNAFRIFRWEELK